MRAITFWSKSGARWVKPAIPHIDVSFRRAAQERGRNRNFILA
jgi:hypothetical protein